MKRPQPRPGIQGITPYAQGKSQISGADNPIKLSSNESALGTSPKAVAAFHQAGELLHRYPEGSQLSLREAIAEVHDLEVGRIVCGNGSEEIIGILVRAYAGPGDEVLLTENHFVMCPIYARVQGAEVVFAPERDFRIDVDLLLECVTPKTRIVIIANPNNPTGTYITDAEVRRLHAALPSQVLLLLDCAYAEYVTEEDYDSGLRLARDSENVVVTRSFSKAHGLAGLRIGWAYGPSHVIDTVHRVRTPFNTNAAALAAAAAAVRDSEFVQRQREHNARSLAYVRSALDQIGLRVIPSVTNFYLLDFGSVPNKSAAGAAAFMESRGIIPRAVATGSAEQVLRVTVGLDHENEAAIAALRDYLDSDAG